MSILIKGMEMPFDGNFATIVIYPDGTVRTRRQDPLPYTAIPIPPHGRLIDADVFDVIAYQGIPDGRENTFDDGVEWLANKIDTAPTIIEAEKEGLSRE